MGHHVPTRFTSEFLVDAVRKFVLHASCVEHADDAVLVLVHKGEGYSGTRAARGHREYARVLGRRHGCAVVIGWLAEGRWRFQTAVKRRAPAAV